MDKKKRAQSPWKAAPEDRTTHANSSTERPLYWPLRACKFVRTEITQSDAITTSQSTEDQIDGGDHALQD